MDVAASLPAAALDFVVPETVPVPAALPGAGVVDDCYTIEIEAYAGDPASAPSIEPDVAGLFPGAVDPTPFAGGATVTVYFSDRSYTSEPDDDPANTFFDARLNVPLMIARSVPLTPEAGTRAVRQIGLIEIANADGAQDATGDLAVDARAVTVKRGVRTAGFDTFDTLFVGTGVKWERSPEILPLMVRGRDYLFEQPLQPVLYGGAGGADGGAELKGKPKPLTFGLCRDVAAVPVQQNALIYQLHDGRIRSVEAVYDRAQELDFDADYASYSALAAATLAPGEYATCLAGGYIRLGGTPVGIVTADLRGDAAAAYGGFTANAASIARRVMLSRGGQAAADLDEDGIAETAGNIAGIVGYHFADPVTVGAALDAICAGAFLWWGSLRDGRFTIRRMQAPGRPRYAIAATDILGDIELPGLPESVDPCNWRRRVNYRRCWTPQAGTEIDNAFLSDARRDFVRQAYRTTTVADATRVVRNLLAADPAPIVSAFDAEHDAAALASNLIAIFAPGRKLYRFPIRAGGHDIDVDDTLRVTHPRHGLADGKDLRVLAMDERHHDRLVDLLLFG